MPSRGSGAVEIECDEPGEGEWSLKRRQESGDLGMKALIERGNKLGGGFRLMCHFYQHLSGLLRSSHFVRKVDPRAFHPLCCT